MKVGMRKPSLKKSIKARTTGKLKREVKRTINPLYGKKGMGWVNNPKKAAYNKVYNKTTFGVNDVIKCASVTSNSKKKSNIKSTNKIKNYNSNGSISSEILRVKKVIGLDLSYQKKVAIILIIAIVLMLTMNVPALLILLALLIIDIVMMTNIRYRVLCRWHRLIKFYVKGNKEKAKEILNKMPEDEKTKDSYKNMLNLLGEYKNEVETEIAVDLDDISVIKMAAKKEKIVYSNKKHNEFIAIDLETTGLDCINDKIVEISAVKYKDGVIVDKFETLIDPEINIPAFITDINNINDSMVCGKPKISEALPMFMKFIEDKPLVAHNARFDIRFLNVNLIECNMKITNEIIDTLNISKIIYPDLENHKLVTIKEYFNLDIQSHRAFEDCVVCAKIYLDYCTQ